MQIPQLDSLSTNRLSRVFNNTVATYKYYWLISILNIHISTGAKRISIWDIVISMVANAWYPVHYFRLSFGKSDSMYMAIKTIRELTDLPYDASKKLIEETLKDQLDKKEIKAVLRVFTLNVSFRFLSPWIHTSENKDVVRRSHSFENGVCNLNSNRIIAENELCIAIRDGFPVSEGHTLIIPKRHVANYFDLTPNEIVAMQTMMKDIKCQLDNELDPDRYNIGINVNAAAGQTVFHVHMHLIPRYIGDVENPKGGVRGVIPGKQKY